MIVREFLTRLGFEADEDKVRSFDGAIGGMVKSLTAAVAVMNAVAVAAFGLANSAAKYGDEVAKSAATIGMTAEELQALRFAYERAGISQDELTTGLERLNRNLGSVAQGEEAARKGFDALGLSVTNADGSMRSVSDLFPEIVEALQGVSSEAERAAIAQELFGRSGVRMGSAMKGGGEELAEMIALFEELGGGLTNEQAKAAEEFSDALSDMQHAFNSIRLQIGAELMPVFRPMIAAFTQFAVANRGKFIEGMAASFKVITEVVGRMASTLTGVIGAFSNLFAMVAGGVDGFDRLGGVIAALALLFLPGKWKFALILVAVLDDISAWAQGHESIIGRLIGPYEDWAASVNGLVEAFGGWEAVADALYVILLGIAGLKLARWAWAATSAVWALSAAFGAASIGAAATAAAMAAIAATAAAGSELIVRNSESVLDTIIPDWRSRDWPDWIDGGLPPEIAPSPSTSPSLGSFMGPAVAPSLDGAAIMDGMDELRGYLDRVTVEGPTAENIAGGDVDNSVANTIMMDFNQSITVPPGTTAEQLAIIRNEAERAITRQIDRAAAALEN